MRAPGQASRIGEWVAMMNCAPSCAARLIAASTRERAGDRQRGLGLVEDVEALAGEAVGGEREERLAVRLLVQLRAAVEREVGRELPVAVDDRGDVEEALGAQEVAVARLGPAVEHRLERAVEHRARDRRELAGALELTALRARSRSPRANASISVDLPVPLSPASSVTGASRSICSTRGAPPARRTGTRRSTGRSPSKPSRYGPGPGRRMSRRFFMPAGRPSCRCWRRAAGR